MANTEENKRIVLEFIGHVSNGDVDRILGCMADDATWTIVGHADVSPAACTRNKTQVKELFEGLAIFFPKGLSTTVKAVTAENNRVAVETETNGVTRDGKVYNNFYHMLYVVKDGKIQTVREYCDLQYVQAVFG